MELFSEHLKKDHLLSKIDARVKLLLALVLLVMILSYKGFFFPLFIILFCLLLGVILRVPLQVFFLRLSEPLFISAVVVFLKTFFSGYLPLFSVSFFGLEITAYQEGLREGLMISGRIIGAVSVLTIMGFSTPFTEFMASLSWLRVPKGFIEVMVFAYRYIFVLLDEGLVIYNSQKTRLGYTSLKRGLSSFGTLTGSLILKVFEHSQNTAMALAQRGFDGRIPMAMERSFKGSEILGSAIFVLTMGCLWMI
ncbi:MAG TPA: cobalt ECF transporter T component CbiQ [Thermodesulfobacteriota bacterium]|nr:cobalt ECF transporter T component CbiQ [Thermodesulfobacteriota bacterium]